jgi:hypothetical protein
MRISDDPRLRDCPAGDGTHAAYPPVPSLKPDIRPEPQAEDRMAHLIDSRRDKDPRQRWKLLYSPACPLDMLYAETSEPYAALRQSIAEAGLRNPLFGTLNGAAIEIHPGKRRVAALRDLGWETVPVVMVEYTPTPFIPENAREITVADLAELFNDEFLITASWRYVSACRRL